MPVVSDYTALLSGFSWTGPSGPLNTPRILTYSFDTALPNYVNTAENPALYASFQAMNAQLQTYVKAALQAWGDASGLIFVETPSGQGDMRFYTLDYEHNAYAPGLYIAGAGSLPMVGGDAEWSGDVSIRYLTNDGWDPTHLLLHEIGHALGLKHPHEGTTTLDPGVDKNTNTVMSYFGDGNPPGTLGALDRQAIQALYGQNTADGSGLTFWSMNTTTWVLTQTGNANANAIYGVFGQDVIGGGEGADTLQGGFGNDTLSGGDGEDRLYGGQGDDILQGGADADRLDGSFGRDQLFGGAGGDTLVSNFAGGDLLDGGDGADMIETALAFGFTRSGTNTLLGGLGNDTLSASYGADSLDGGVGDDRLSTWFLGDYTAVGGAGHDTLQGSGGADQLFGDDGDDFIQGGAGVNFLRGGTGNDYIAGGADFDDAHGNQGDDTVSGGDFDDWVVGGQGADLLLGDAGGDVVLGNLGNDTCYGGLGVDVLRGGQADDVVYGDAGNDYVSGDRGSDTLYGGAGADVFHSFAESDVDRVMDFSIADGDRVLLDPGTAYSVAQVGADTVIDFGGSNRMILVGVQMSALPEGWLVLSWTW